MTGRALFDGYSGPSGLIDRMIGEEYDNVKAVAEKLPDLQEILDAIAAIEDFNTLMTELTAAKNAAAASATDADTSEAAALSSKTQAQASQVAALGSATDAASSAASALTSKNAAASSATSANNSAIAAGTSQSAAASSATLANNWATKTSGEVVSGQGYGAKKYAQDAASSAIDSAGSADLAEAAYTSALAAKNDAVEIVGFDGSLYASKAYAKQQAKRAAIVFGS